MFGILARSFAIFSARVLNLVALHEIEIFLWTITSCREILLLCVHQRKLLQLLDCSLYVTGSCNKLSLPYTALCDVTCTAAVSTDVENVLQ